MKNLEYARRRLRQMPAWLKLGLLVVNGELLFLILAGLRRLGVLADSQVNSYLEGGALIVFLAWALLLWL